MQTHSQTSCRWTRSRCCIHKLSRCCGSPLTSTQVFPIPYRKISILFGNTHSHVVSVITDLIEHPVGPRAFQPVKPHLASSSTSAMPFFPSSPFASFSSLNTWGKSRWAANKWYVAFAEVALYQIITGIMPAAGYIDIGTVFYTRLGSIQYIAIMGVWQLSFRKGLKPLRCCRM